MTVTGPIFKNPVGTCESYMKKAYSKLHESQINGLVADAKSKTE
jgi:hypothetical protein